MRTEPYVCPVCPTQIVEVIEQGETANVPGYYGRLRFGDESMDPCPNCGSILLPSVNTKGTSDLTRAAA